MSKKEATENSPHRLLSDEEVFAIIASTSEDGFAPPDRYDVARAVEARLMAHFAADKLDAAHWRDLLRQQTFNNVHAVGFAINRTKERVAKAGK